MLTYTYTCDLCGEEIQQPDGCGVYFCAAQKRLALSALNGTDGKHLCTPCLTALRNPSLLTEHTSSETSAPPQQEAPK